MDIVLGIIVITCLVPFSNIKSFRQEKVMTVMMLELLFSIFQIDVLQHI